MELRIVEKIKKKFADKKNRFYICKPNYKKDIRSAKIAQLVEHDLAKVGVAGSSPVFRSGLIIKI